MPRSGTTSEGRAKSARWHEAPHSNVALPVAESFNDPAIIPPKELAERIAGQVLVHLLAGRWGQAHVALTEGEQEAREIANTPEHRAMPIGQRLDQPVAAMCLPTRLTNLLERSGMATVYEVVESWPHFDQLSARQGRPLVTYRTEMAKVLMAWNLLTREQLHRAANEGLIEPWWGEHRVPESSLD